MEIYQRIAYVCLKVPFGSVATYGQIALLCGAPRNSRQVGYALNKKLNEVKVPAHRIVNHKGFLSGAGAFETPEEQRRLLVAEGIEVDKENRVNLKMYGWKHTLAEAEQFRRYFEEQNI